MAEEKKGAAGLLLLAGIGILGGLAVVSATTGEKKQFAILVNGQPSNTARVGDTLTLIWDLGIIPEGSVVWLCVHDINFCANNPGVCEGCVADPDSCGGTSTPDRFCEVQDPPLEAQGQLDILLDNAPGTLPLTADVWLQAVLDTELVTQSNKVRITITE